MVTFDTTTGALIGAAARESRRTLAGLQGYFQDEEARAVMRQDLLVYRVVAWEPEPEGHPGAVCLATTFLEPGLVGKEYFLTRGHFHANQDRPELEMTLSGEGLLVLMDRSRRTRTEPMTPGSVHHVPPGTAHRVVNTGERPLVFVSYWASETGHDYRTIADEGFGARVFVRDGRAVVVSDPRRVG
jgi:glucose-6-phosphate isomerase